MKSSFIKNSKSSKLSYQNFEKLLPKFLELGFTPDLIWEAFKEGQGNGETMLNILIQKNKMSKEKSGQKRNSEEDSQIKKAISISLKQQTIEETLNPEDYLRKQDHPVGLSNLGMTCYFNTVVQTLFQIKEIRNLILKEDFDNKEGKKLDPEQIKHQSLLKEMQILFAHLIKGKKSFTNPKQLFTTFQTFDQNVFKIGEQADFLEFQNICFELIEKAFEKLNEKENKSESDSSAEDSKDSSLDDFIMIKKSHFNNDQDNNSKEQTENNQKQNQEITNPMTKLFYGEVQECMQYKTEGDSDQCIKRFSDQILGIVNLQVQYGELFKAIQNSFKYEIDEYTTQKGQKTSAMIEMQIQKVPKILNFYINRLSFDKKSFEPVKIQDPFKFEKDIFMDHFVLDNDKTYQKSEEQDKQIKDLDRKINKMQKILDNWDQYGKNNLQLDHCIGNVLEFLQKQQKSQDEFIDIEEYELNLNEYTGHIGDLGQGDQLKSAIDILSNYSDKLKNKKKKLKDEIELLKKKRMEIYNSNKKYHYRLFSILMHEGGANSGHYFCYVYDDIKECWWKFNDRKVTLADEEKIFQEAYGAKNSKRNACSLFYKQVEPNSKQQEQQIEKSQAVTLSARLNQVVKKSNDEFLNDLDFRKVKQGLEGLKLRCDDIVKQHIKQINSEDYHNFFTKYCDFDRYLLSDKNYQHLGKWNILKTLLEKADYQLVVDSLNNKENLPIAIDQFFKDQKKNYGFEGYKLSEIEQQNFDALRDIFETLILLCYKLENEVYTNFNNVQSINDHLNHLGQIKAKILSNNKKYNIIPIFARKFGSFIDHLLKASLLKACFALNLFLQKNEQKQIQPILMSIENCVLSFYTEKGDLLVVQIIQNLKNTMANYTENQDTINQIKQIITKLENISKNTFNLTQIENTFKFVQSENFENLDGIQIAQNLEKQVNLVLESIGLWREFIQEMSQKKKVIDQETRFNKEILLYHTV